MSKELMDEIDAFLGGDEPQAVTEPETGEEVVVEEPSADEPSADADDGLPEDDSAQDEPGKPAEPVEPASDNVELSELEELKKQNELLQARLNEAYSKPQPPKEETKPAVNLSDDDLLMGMKFDDIIESQESFQSFLKQFMTKTVEITRENVLKDLPKTVNSLTHQQIEARKTVDTFYGEHPQLATVKPYVAQVVSTVAAEHADWELPRVLEEAAERTYKALGLKRQVEKAERKKPAFAPTQTGGGPRGRSSDPSLSKLEQEIAELL